MISLRLAMVALASVAFTAGPAELQVLRTSAADQEPTEPITITFDRPVAGGLDGAGGAGGAGGADASAFFRIEPAVPGRAEWRDPVTLRFRPSLPLARQRVYRVTIPAGLKGMDGSVLASPYVFEVRPPGPAVVDAWAENG